MMTLRGAFTAETGPFSGHPGTDASTDPRSPTFPLASRTRDPGEGQELVGRAGRRDRVDVDVGRVALARNHDHRGRTVLERGQVDAQRVRRVAQAGQARVERSR